MFDAVLAFFVSLFFVPLADDPGLGQSWEVQDLAPPALVTFDRPYGLDEIDAFAARVLDDLQKPSFANNVEYCGMIVTRDGISLAATKAARGRNASCVIDYPDDVRGLRILASYHTHAGDDVRADGEVPSVPDLESDIADGVPGYVATPGGRLWKTDPVRRAVRLICPKGCVARDPRFVDCPGRAAGTYHTLRDLRARQNTSDGTCPVPDRFRRNVRPAHTGPRSSAARP